MARPDTGRRELIRSTALDAFTERGYDGTTIGELATRLGISKAAIGYYYPTKDTFLVDFVEPVLDDLDHAVRSAAKPNAGWPDAARAVCDAYLHTLTEHQPIARWIDTDQALQALPDFGGRLARINQRVIRSITASRRKSDRLRAYAVLGGLWRPLREFDAHDIAAHHDELIDAALVSYGPLDTPDA